MNPVDRLHKDHHEIVSYFDEKGEISFRSAADENFRKSLLLAAASYFEERVSEDLLQFFSETSNQLAVEIIRSKAIKRQYHNLFDWDSNNANRFFSLFGASFKSFMVDEIKANDDLNNAIKAFITLGQDRNRLVHQNFGTFTLEKTADEIYELYKQALVFVEAIPNKLNKYLQSNQNSEDV
ncbi:MAG: hypothetical protein KDD89_05030 [Anaerolineales bacterium]|nr:hypothetical protein [Anaerolineales bacterium]